ncbi:MAG: hypothetical protein AAFQ95_16635, partial [Cyanobacteria bacterium J06621_3]
LEETPKKLATPTCQKLGWLWHDDHNLHNCVRSLGASYRCWFQPMPIATKFFEAVGHSHRKKQRATNDTYR